jgi:3'(2'), 5'-bisphosphate nucleotidase
MLPELCRIAREAGQAILEVYARDFTTTTKADSSPLTEADLAANTMIVRRLAELTPEIPILTEESATVDFEVRRHWSQFWLVDPLDGTKEFIQRNGDFTVNIALIQDCVPTVGIVFAPVWDLLYYGQGGQGSYRVTNGNEAESIRVAPYREGPMRVVASRSHAGPETEAYLQALEPVNGNLELVSRGSSLKLCMVAEGSAHLYPRLGPTMEWDTAAADAVVRAAGGQVTTLDGAPLAYNKPNLLNPFFVVQALTGR